MKALSEQLQQEFDYVIIDCPAGIEQGFKNAIAGAQKAIVVTTPEVAAVRMQIGSSVYWRRQNLRNPSWWLTDQARYGEKGRYDGY